MKLALAILCVVSVAFLLRVLAAFVNDARSSSPLGRRFYFASFVPSLRRAELVLLSHELQRSDLAGESGEQIAS
jgi:hypothetical protein